MACFVRPGEVACIWTDDEDNPFYEAAHAAYETLSNATDAKGRQLKVHKLTMPKEPTYMTQEEVDAIDVVEGTIPVSYTHLCCSHSLELGDLPFVIEVPHDEHRLALPVIKVFCSK